jgi:hypothetical protein
MRIPAAGGMAGRESIARIAVYCAQFRGEHEALAIFEHVFTDFGKKMKAESAIGSHPGAATRGAT